MIGLGIGINYSRVIGSIDTQAQAHYDRVIADGGIMPAGLLGCNAWFVAVKAVYGVTDITTAISAGYDPHYLGAKIGAGSGTTLGQAATKLYSCSGASGDLVQETAASQPLLLAHSGVNYWFGSGILGNYCSTPNAAANQITGDIEFIAKVDYTDNGTYNFILNKISSGGYGFAISPARLIYFEINVGGSPVGVISSSAISTPFTGYIKANRSNSTGVVKIYTSIDGVTYSQLGTDLSTTTGAITPGIGVLNIGRSFNDTYKFQGKISRVTISNSIGGTPVVDFNPSSYNAATSQTQWTSTTGEVWTISTGTATTGYKGVLVDRTIMQGDGVDDKMNQTGVNRSNNCSQYLAVNALASSASGQNMIVDSSNTNYSNAIWFSPSNQYIIWLNAASSNIVISALLNRVSFVSAITNAGVQNSIGLNNGTPNTNTYTPTPSNTGLSIFASATGIPANAILNTYISANSIDNSTTQTAMYNLIRVLNNSSF